MKKWFKSKTINLNALLLAVVGVLGAVGYEVQPEVVAGIGTLMNVVLRFVTKEPITA
jgi:hypothetical protein